MRRVGYVFLTLAAVAVVAGPARAEAVSSRVIVSSTLDGTLHVFDAVTLAETQPPLPSKGTSPVRLWVQKFDGQTYLFSANHGVQGSVGAFDLDGDVVTELPLSPFPSGGPGSVGIAAGSLRHLEQAEPVVVVTNTVHALGTCAMPDGSVTLFDAGLLNSAGLLRESATSPSGGSLPYAVALDETGGTVYTSNNCNANLVQMQVGTEGINYYGTSRPLWDFTLERTGHGTTGGGPDAVLFDAAYGRAYVTNIGGDSVSVFGTGLSASGSPALTTVPLPGTGPIDATLADSKSGARWLITSNGKNDTVSIIDRAAIDACVLNAVATCNAEEARIYAGVVNGAPEGVAYDPATNRVFVVNKTLFDPSLSVIQLTETGGTVQSSLVGVIPLQKLGYGPLRNDHIEGSDIIAFDVVVQMRP